MRRERESIELREAGKTGEPGWTKAAKMPQWDSRENSDDRHHDSSRDGDARKFGAAQGQWLRYCGPART